MVWQVEGVEYPPTNEWGAPWTRGQIRRRGGFRTVWQWGCIQPCFLL
jgi:hypothetical protein